MSHFSVLVVGPDVEGQLDPYHEFECTGTVDQYVIDVDITEEARASYKADTRAMLRDADGGLHSFFDGYGNYKEQFSQPGKHGMRDRFVPEGFTEIEVPEKDLVSFEVWIKNNYGYAALIGDEPLDIAEKHKFGYCHVVNHDVVKVIKRTNPNAKWDYWVVGGRWECWLNTRFGSDSHCLKRAVDFEGMRNKAESKAAAHWDEAALITGNGTWEPWEVVRAKHAPDIDAARAAYCDQPVLAKLSEKFDNPFADLDEYLVPRHQFLQEARDRACVPYALVMNGEWHARGEMGWWGVSSDEVDQGEWNRKVNELLDSLPDDTLLTVVDCHI